jgi:aldehyde:ferredoxin oxidoreductase
MLNEITGWELSLEEALDAGRRTVNLFRVFNLRSGISSRLDYPSERLWSAAPEGPAKGKAIKPYWNDMLLNYYELMGWDQKTGKPLPDTLKKLGLEHIIPDIW